MRTSSPALLLLLLAGACGPAPQAPAGPPDAGSPDKSARCAATFGSALTNGFARLDGTVLAIVPPGLETCALPNGDHLVVQVLMNGAPYRLVVNVLSDGRNGTDTRLRYAEVARPLPAPAWSEGWHTGLALDYAADLGVHTADFAPSAMDELVAKVSDRLALDARVSVYASSRNRPESAHLVHRNGARNDGAIVVGPDTPSPLFLLFHFDGQVF